MQQYGPWSDNKQAPAETIHNAIRTINLPTVTLKVGCGLSHQPLWKRFYTARRR
jgi:hypothetical protein